MTRIVQFWSFDPIRHQPLLASLPKMAIGLEKIRSAAESFASLHAGHHAVPVIRPVTAQGDPKNCSGRRTDFAGEDGCGELQHPLHFRRRAGTGRPGIAHVVRNRRPGIYAGFGRLGPGGHRQGVPVIRQFEIVTAAPGLAVVVHSGQPGSVDRITPGVSGVIRRFDLLVKSERRCRSEFDIYLESFGSTLRPGSEAPFAYDFRLNVGGIVVIRTALRRKCRAGRKRADDKDVFFIASTVFITNLRLLRRPNGR